jgi:hypothetical protein
MFLPQSLRWPWGIEHTYAALFFKKNCSNRLRWLLKPPVHPTQRSPLHISNRNDTTAWVPYMMFKAPSVLWGAEERGPCCSRVIANAEVRVSQPRAYLRTVMNPLHTTTSLSFLVSVFASTGYATRYGLRFPTPAFHIRSFYLAFPCQLHVCVYIGRDQHLLKDRL